MSNSARRWNTVRATPAGRYEVFVLSYDGELVPTGFVADDAGWLALEYARHLEKERWVTYAYRPGTGGAVRALTLRCEFMTGFLIKDAVSTEATNRW